MANITDRVRSAAVAEMEAHLAYYAAKQEADKAHLAAVAAQSKVQELYAKYQAAVMERNEAVVEMFSTPPG